jgi:thiamine pyrophosphokinase
MASDLSPQTLLQFVIGDFETAWDAIARVSGPVNRGNSIFGKQAMVLLELACRLCQSDSTRAALGDLSAALNKRDPRYFWALPGRVWAPSSSTRAEFSLPGLTGDRYGHLLAAIFNLVRNGQAHQYQQMRAALTSGENFRVSLTGAKEGRFLRTVLASERPSSHLSCIAGDHDLLLIVRSDVLFLDIRDAVRSARLDQRGLSLKYLVEGGKKTFGFDRSALVASLEEMNR